MADTNAIRERRKATSTDILSDEPLGNTAATNSSSPAATETNPTKLANKLAKEEDAAPFSLVDILRSIVFIVIASCGLSYVVTKESFVWGLQRPHWTYPVVIKGYLVRGFLSFCFFGGGRRRKGYGKEAGGDTIAS